MNKHHKTLELDKILEMLANKASVEESQDLIRSITPSFNLDEVSLLIQKTDDAYKLISGFKSPSFGRVKPIKLSVMRAQSGGSLLMKELLQIAEVLRVSRSLKEWREHCEGCRADTLDSHFDTLYINKYFEEKIFSSIKSEDEMSDSASSKLADIRRKIRHNGQSVRDKLDSMIRSSTSKYLQENIITQRDGRFVVPVKSEHRGEVPGLVHDTSSSGATLFIEPMAVVELNNEIRMLRIKEKEEIERILAEFSAEVAEFSDRILSAYDDILALDIVFAKAGLAVDMKASKPSLNDKGTLYLKNARHPLLNKKTAVPVTVSLGIDYDTLVITGPNTGGKTVTLKTIGLFTLMAMCGMMIPADDGSEICVFDNVLADIGDEQSIEQSFSTFSGHMTNIVSILNTATCDSLVLIDELGAGTDPVEGAALATSILMRLREYGVKTAATTHYAELKSYAIETDRVCNACCEFDVETLKPTYKLIIGAPGRSNAFAISSRLGLDNGIIKVAKNLVTDKDSNFEKVIAALDTARRETEAEKDISQKLRWELESEKKKLSDEKNKFEAEKKKLMDKARDEARGIVEKTRKESQNMLDELAKIIKERSLTDDERIRRAREIAKKGIKNSENAADPLEKAKKAPKLPRELVIGDIVEIIDIDKKATVLEKPKSNGTVLVMAGIIRTTVSLDNLRLIDSDKTTLNKKPVSKKKVEGIPSRLERTANTEIDLRGMNSDEAIMELDRYIDNSVISGINMLTVIHGKGTGVLRKSVQDYLRHNKHVRSFRLGVFGEGEAGVTIVELK